MGGSIEIVESSETGTVIKAFFKYKVNSLTHSFPSHDVYISKNKVKKDSSVFKSYIKDKRRIIESKHNILVVEDSKITSMLISSFLRGDKFSVVPTFSGKDAIELCKDTEFDVILMDANMPGISGFQTINRIKQECSLNVNTPVIVMSGTNIDDIGSIHSTTSTIHFLTKPIRKNTLVRVLSKYTDPN